MWIIILPSSSLPAIGPFVHYHSRPLGVWYSKWLQEAGAWQYAEPGNPGIFQHWSCCPQEITLVIVLASWGWGNHHWFLTVLGAGCWRFGVEGQAGVPRWYVAVLFLRLHQAQRPPLVSFLAMAPVALMRDPVSWPKSSLKTASPRPSQWNSGFRKGDWGNRILHSTRTTHNHKQLPIACFLCYHFILLDIKVTFLLLSL